MNEEYELAAWEFELLRGETRHSVSQDWHEVQSNNRRPSQPRTSADRDMEMVLDHEYDEWYSTETLGWTTADEDYDRIDMEHWDRETELSAILEWDANRWRA